MTGPRKINIGDAKAATGRNANVSAARLGIERLLASLPREQTLSLDQIADHLSVSVSVVRQRLQQMRHECLAVNIEPRGTPSRWRLSAAGRRSVAGPRQYNPAKAKPGTLSPWAGGTPVREGAMVAFALPSRGIKA